MVPNLVGNLTMTHFVADSHLEMLIHYSPWENEKHRTEHENKMIYFSTNIHQKLWEPRKNSGDSLWVETRKVQDSRELVQFGGSHQESKEGTF